MAPLPTLHRSYSPNIVIPYFRLDLHSAFTFLRLHKRYSLLSHIIYYGSFFFPENIFPGKTSHLLYFLLSLICLRSTDTCYSTNFIFSEESLCELSDFLQFRSVDLYAWRIVFILRPSFTEYEHSLCSSLSLTESFIFSIPNLHLSCFTLPLVELTLQ